MEKIEEIILIINEWDPIDLFPLAPKDEYTKEAEKIIDLIKIKRIISINELTNEINDLFLKTFGEDVYQVDNRRCKEIAEKILQVFSQ